MSDIAQFIAMPIDRTDQGLVAGEAFKCASPQAAIERARGYWKSSVTPAPSPSCARAILMRPRRC